MIFDFDAMSAFDQYKIISATVSPRPIAWVVSQNVDGALNAAPFSFFNICSEDPPMVSLGLGGWPWGAQKDTTRNILSTGEFVVNMVSEDVVERMITTAVDFPADVSEVEMAQLATVPSQFVKPPRIADSPVSFECTLFQSIAVNNKGAIVIGKIRAAHVRDDAVLDQARCYIDVPALKLVGRMEGKGWYTRTTDRFELDWMTHDEWKDKSARK